MNSNEGFFERVNKDLLRSRLKEIRTGSQIIKKYISVSLDEFLSNPERIAATKYEIIVIIGSAVAICNHIAVRVGSRTPESYSDCFNVLKDSKIISENLAGRLVKMAQFRNLLVHRYWKIDDKRVNETLKKNLKDLEEYLKEIGKYLKKETGFNEQAKTKQ